MGGSKNLEHFVALSDLENEQGSIIRKILQRQNLSLRISKNDSVK